MRLATITLAAVAATVIVPCLGAQQPALRPGIVTKPDINFKPPVVAPKVFLAAGTYRLHLALDANQGLTAGTLTQQGHVSVTRSGNALSISAPGHTDLTGSVSGTQISAAGTTSALHVTLTGAESGSGAHGTFTMSDAGHSAHGTFTLEPAVTSGPNGTARKVQEWGVTTPTGTSKGILEIISDWWNGLHWA